MAWVVDAEDGCARTQAREVADLRIVRVHDQSGHRRQLRDGDPPLLGEPFELAVPVQLVAEQVAE